MKITGKNNKGGGNGGHVFGRFQWFVSEHVFDPPDFQPPHLETMYRVSFATNLYLWQNIFRMSVADSTGKDVASNRLMGDLQMPNAQGGGSLASRIGAADGQFGWLQSSPLFAWFSKKKFPASRSKRIDVVARIVFPIIFAIFNLSYWTFYLLRDPGPQLP